ncbi:MAG TPA: ABC transporter ATP-binding protein [Acidimicrobiia bacterium]|nr:ABC transporter ATP-binding protein [Acidimicrobiia bacterium]
MSIVLRSVGVSIGGTTILDDIDLVVDDAERFAIMGPSGAGKSTILRVIAGLIPQHTGTVTIRGVDVTGLPPHRRNVGLMFQDYALFPHLSVGENVAYGLRMGGVDAPVRTEQASELLAVVGLAGYASRGIGSLSGGEQQRVALARTLAPQPAVVLFDEPLGSLDQALKDDLLVEMREITGSLGITSVYVTHDRLEAEGFADRLAIIDEGRVIRTDTPEAIWQAPGTEFVARFIGHRNIVDASILGSEGLIVVPESAVMLDPSGTIDARVSACLFRDGRYRVSATTTGGTLHTVTGSAVPVGQSVRIAIDESGVIALVDDGPESGLHDAPDAIPLVDEV